MFCLTLMMHWLILLHIICVICRLSISQVQKRIVKGKFISEAIDYNVDPCRNFYQFACGNWQKNNPTPADATEYNIFRKLDDIIYAQIKDILEWECNNSTAKYIKIMKQLYSKCMDIARINTLKSSPLMEGIIWNYGWPLFNLKSRSNKMMDLTDLLGSLRKNYGLEVFFSVEVDFDDEDSSKNVIWITSEALDKYITDSKHSNFRKRSKRSGSINQIIKNKSQLYNVYLDLIANDLGLTVTKQIKSDFNKIQLFHNKLSDIDKADYDAKTYNVKMTVKELQELVPSIDWYRYFEIIMPPEVYGFVRANPNLSVNVFTTVYLKLLHTIFTVNENSSMVDNYAIWRLIKFSINNLDLRFGDALLKLNEQRYGVKTKSARWEKCVYDVEKHMNFGLGVLYIRRSFDESTRGKALSMVAHLKEAFGEVIEELEWMDIATKSYALEKINALTVHIGYGTPITDQYVDNFYSNVNIAQDDNYFTILKKIVAWKLYEDFYSFLKPYEKSDILPDAIMTNVNAHYKVTNEMTIFPAIILPPFFDKDYPNVVNYGGLGFVIGHEFTHGFDLTGRKFDKTGSAKDWWSTYSLENYQGKVSCIRHLYDKVEVSEDIADIGGIKIAFEAYKDISEKSGFKEKIPGLENFTDDQIFFLSYATTWCENINPNYAIRLSASDDHSMHDTRVIQTLSNFNEFSNSFGCPKGSKMNPINTGLNERCSVWDDIRRKRL